MAKSSKGVKIKVTAKDMASKKLKKSFSGIQKSIGSAAAAWLSFQGVMKGKELLVAGTQIQQTTEAFKRLASVAGVSSDEIMKKLKEVSGGAVADFDLMQAAARSSLLGIGFEDQVQLMEIARATSRATGQTVTKAFDDITLAVGRGSKMILDNLGIILSVEKANEQYAAQIGKTATELNDAERKQAFMNATFKAGAVHVKNLGAETSTTAEQLASSFANVQNTFDKFKLSLVGLTPLVQNWLSGIDSAFNDWLDGFDYIVKRIDDSSKESLVARRNELKGLIKANEEAKGAAKGLFEFMNSIRGDKGIDAGTAELKKEYDELELKISSMYEASKNKAKAYNVEVANGVRELKKHKALLGDISVEDKDFYESNKKNTDAIFEQAAGLREVEAVLKRITEESKSGTGWGEMDRWQRDDIYADEDDERTQAAIEFVESQKQREQELLEAKKSALEEHRALLAEGAAYDKEMQNKEAAEAAERFKKTWGQSIESMQNRFASFASDGINEFIDGTKSAGEAFSDFAASFVKDIAKMIIKQQLLNMVSKFGGGSGGGSAGGGAGGFGSMLGGILASKSAKGGVFNSGKVEKFAKGGVFNSGKVEKFAKGGIVTGPTAVPMALMGEGGRQEAVLPLGRDGHGDLGVKAMIGDNNPPAVSGNSESNGQPITKNETINNYNMSIQAMDSKSFMEFARKNPSAFAAVFKDNVAKGDSATLSAINSARGR